MCHVLGAWVLIRRWVRLHLCPSCVANIRKLSSNQQNEKKISSSFGGIGALPYLSRRTKHKTYGDMALNDNIQYKNSAVTYFRPRQEMRETNDCVVRALAAALDITYEYAHSLAKEYMNRRDRQGVWNTDLREGIGVIADICGYEVVRRFYDAPLEYSAYYLENRRHTGRFPLLRYALRNPKGRHLLLVKGHAVAMVDQVVFDNGDRTSGRHNVLDAFTFIPKQ